VYGSPPAQEPDADAPIVSRLRAFLQQPATEAERAAADRWLRRLFAPRRRRQPSPTTVWNLAEGDELEDGHRVLEVRRDARSGTVQVLTSEPVTTPYLPGDAPVVVMR
jgi:hypothetical protein